LLRIQPAAWTVMQSHAEQTYPRECCGAFLGRGDEVMQAIPLDNVYEGGQEDRFEIRPADLVRVERESRTQGVELLGIYHSHPDCDAYFSRTDLENSCPWYKSIVLSVKQGRFDHANAFETNDEQTVATPVSLERLDA
jgi:proteasome lid subunit RPN8/RPN11